MTIDIDELIKRIAPIYDTTAEEAFHINTDEIIRICLHYIEDNLIEEFYNNQDHYISIYTKAKEDAENS